ncbi:MAG: VCBS repeat-containing protein [Lewinella sp.]
MGKITLRLRHLPVLLSLLLCACQPGTDTVFTRLSPDKTGIEFVNLTGENDSFNILTNEYIYNGGGVGIGDFNADGQPDVFFSGSENENELYLNRGNWKFENISDAAGIGGEDRWNNGVTIVDVNNDGLDDIYVCATLRDNRSNQLFVNQGNGGDGIPTFVDMAPTYGIADPGHNTQAAWLDYDKDGDLDLFLLVNKMVNNKQPNTFSRKVKDGSGERTDKLYRQDRVGDQITFTEVGKETGILFQGFSLAVTVCDLNKDGWPDLYVSNDYLSNDLAYLNVEQENGGRYFKDVSYQLVKHTSYSAMGNDVADLNNDGLPDILAVDMLPAENQRRKMMLQANNYTYYLNLKRYGYHPQFVRNSLQISQGHRIDSLSSFPQYADVAMQSGLPATDWSWTPLVADFDLDGRKDVIITNGFPRDITDKDFGDYNAANSRFFSMEKMLPKIPSVKIPNVAFRSSAITDGIPQFDDVSKAWGIDVTSFSNGAAYADLDGDGDLDYIVNNIDDPAHVYRNNTISGKENDPGFLRLQVPAGTLSVDFWGAEVTVKDEEGPQTYYWHPHRGYLSSHGQDIIAGINGPTTVEVRWNDGTVKQYGPFQLGETAVLDSNSGESILAKDDEPTSATLLAPVSSPAFTHEELDYIDFNVQPMLLRKISQQGPALAVTDWNEDGIDDIYVSGGYDVAGTFLEGTTTGFQQVPTRFTLPSDNKQEELGSLFFDADGDGDDDLYIISGSYEFRLENGDYQDRFYRNEDGKFIEMPDVLAAFPIASGAAVKAADYDLDGDLDLFIGNRLVPFTYPKPVQSYFLRNDSEAGNIQFTKEEVPALDAVENVCDALFTDYDNDGRPDLLIAGEWAPLRLLRNTDTGWEEATHLFGDVSLHGWWNSLSAGDFDNDGDIDYVAGNFGHNSIIKPSAEEPMTATLSDFDENGGLDFIPHAYFTDVDGTRKSFPFFNRNDFAKQVTKIKSIYTSHAAYSTAGTESYRKEGGEQYAFRVDNFSSVYIENTPEGFVVSKLPEAAQAFPVFGMLSLDLNGDDFLDLVMIGNDFGGEVSQGFLDAGNGLILLGDGQGGFQSQPAERSGLSVPGEGRALVLANGASGPLLVAAQNNGPLVLARPQVPYSVSKAGNAGTVSLPGGGTRRVESYWGSGYLGQSTRLSRFSILD